MEDLNNYKIFITIRRLAKEAKLEQVDFKKAMGFPHGTFSEWWHGENPITSPVRVYTIAQFLTEKLGRKVTTDELISGNEDDRRELEEQLRRTEFELADTKLQLNFLKELEGKKKQEAA